MKHTKCLDFGSLRWEFLPVTNQSERPGCEIEYIISRKMTRHEAITRVCRKRGIRDAQRFAGHGHIGTTQRYDHVETEEIRKVQENLFDDD